MLYISLLTFSLSQYEGKGWLRNCWWKQGDFLSIARWNFDLYINSRSSYQSIEVQSLGEMGLQESTFMEEKKRRQVIGPKRLLNSKNKIQMKHLPRTQILIFPLIFFSCEIPFSLSMITSLIYCWASIPQTWAHPRGLCFWSCMILEVPAFCPTGSVLSLNSHP